MKSWNQRFGDLMILRFMAVSFSCISHFATNSLANRELARRTSTNKEIELWTFLFAVANIFRDTHLKSDQIELFQSRRILDCNFANLFIYWRKVHKFFIIILTINSSWKVERLKNKKG